jgi:hypothetical protein
MNCQRFEEVINDVAREQIMDAATRHDATRHARECLVCGNRFDDEQELTIGLRQLVDYSASELPAKEVEVRLLQAFDEHRILTPRTVPSRRYWIAAVAAMLLIAFGLLVVRSWQRSATPGAQEANQIPKNNVEQPTDPSPEQLQRLPEMTRNDGTSKHRIKRNVRPAKDELTNHVSDIGSQFIPVSYGSTADLDAGGQIVRVELPRSAIAALGLPVNMDRSDQKVKVDVLVGIDGRARAIRLVSSQMSLDSSKNSP